MHLCHPMAVSLLLVLCLCIAAGLAQDAYPSDASDVVRAGRWQAVVLGDYVYLDGGGVTEIGSPEFDKNSPRPIKSTLSLDLRTSWSTNDVNPKQSSLDQKPLRYSEPFFSDPESRHMYKWGGRAWDAENDTVADLWAFEADGRGGGTWGIKQLGNQDVFKGFMAVANAASVNTPDGAFIFGGHDWKDLQGPNLKGWYKFNFTTAEWSLDTEAGYSKKYGTIFGATATYVDGFGSAGLIFILGGIPSRDTPDGQYMPWETVWFYDIGAGRWHTQETSGYGDDNSRPDRRRHHCAVGVRGSGEDSTFEIFVFGGSISSGKKDWGDVWALSIPGFHWTRAKADETDKRRAQHACVGAKSSMLTFGGVESFADGGEGWSDQDALRGGLGIFDLNNLEWTTDYKAEAESYKTHERIRSWYDEGNLANVSWGSDEIAALFTSPSTPHDGGGRDNGDDKDAGSSTPIGAIVGGTVGGVVGLAVCGGVAWYLIRRKRKQSQSVTFNAANHSKSTGQQPPQMSQAGREESTPYSYVTSGAPGVASPTELPGSDAGRPPFEMDTARRPAALERAVD